MHKPIWLKTPRDPRRWIAYGTIFFIGLMLVWTYRILDKRAQIPPPPTQALIIRSGALAHSPLYDVLLNEGLDRPEIFRITSAFRKILNPKNLQHEDRYRLGMSTSGVFHGLTVTHGLKRYSVAAVRHIPLGPSARSGSALEPRAAVHGNRLKSQIWDIPLETLRHSRQGEIRNSLWDSMIREKISPQLILQFADVFAWNIDFLTETRDRDRYALIWQETRTPEGTVTEYQILAAAYQGEETGKRIALRFNNSYYNENGESLQRFFLRAPLSYRRISSYFTQRRFHPILRYFRPHLGIDYAAPTGTPVSSVGEGTVIRAGWNNGFGNYVEIRHNHSYVTSYGHLSRFAKGIHENTRVKQGQVIGYVGATGLATGPHLDFRIQEKGRYVNFLRLKFHAAVALGKKKRTEFLASTKNILSEIEALLNKHY